MVSTGISGSGTVSRTAMIAALPTASSATPPTSSILHPFERQRDSLADADAHCGERELAAGPLQLLGRGERQPRAGHPERMAERDRPAVGVHALIVIGDAELTQHREALRGECLVQF